MDLSAKIYVAGHQGMVGAALVRCLHSAGYENILVRDAHELDLCNQAAVAELFATEQPMYVFLAADRVGGIYANTTYPADFLYDNLQSQTNVVHASHQHGVRKLLLLGSSCIYPRLAPQPIREEYLLTGPLELTNEAFSVAQIAGIKLCQAYRRQHGSNFIAAMPTNLYGPGDNYDAQNSYVLPALLRKFHTAIQQEASTVEVWGTGTPRREFLHVDDLADACLFLMRHYDEMEPINIGTGEDISVGDLARLIQRITSFRGKVRFNALMPDGTPRKVLDISRLTSLGWRATIPLIEGIRQVYKLQEWVQDAQSAAR